MPKKAWGDGFEEASSAWYGVVEQGPEVAVDLYRVIRAVTRAVLPGRQQKKNLRREDGEGPLDKAEKAARDTLRGIVRKRSA